MSYFNRKHIINYTKRKKSMKLQIKSFIAIAILSGVIATGCSGNKKNSANVDILNKLTPYGLFKLPPVDNL